VVVFSLETLYQAVDLVSLGVYSFPYGALEAAGFRYGQGEDLASV
jgi:hypothetical protein